MTSSLPQPGTRERIIAAAQRLFAQHGFGETSLRMITSEAGVNLAAVNYHFGTKDGLIAEVFHDLVAPVNEERIRRLDRLEGGNGKKVPLEKIIEAFLTPALMTWKDRGSVAMRLMGRTYAESNAEILRLFRQQFREVVVRFSAALGRALPELPDEEVIWRLQFAVGSMAHTMAHYDQIVSSLGGARGRGSLEDLIHRLTLFITAGMKAPAPTALASGGSSPVPKRRRSR